MQGELEPVDNRADAKKRRSRKGEVALRARSAGWEASPSWHLQARPPPRRPSATRRGRIAQRNSAQHHQQAPRALDRALPGPQTTGVGLIPGSGMGGGGGSGGGSGEASAAASARGPSSSAPASTGNRSPT